MKSTTTFSFFDLNCDRSVSYVGLITHIGI